MLMFSTTVDVDGTPCEVVAHSPSEVRCWTGRPPQDSPAIADEELAYPVVDEGYRFRGVFTTWTLSIQCLHSPLSRFLSFNNEPISQG